MGEPPAADHYRTVHCERHGDRRQAFICDHLLQGSGHGFFTADEPGDSPPDAWCHGCEQIRLAHGGIDGEWNDESQALIKVRLVCGDCYEEIRARSVPGTENTRIVQ